MKQICKNNDEKISYIFVLIVEAIFKDKEKVEKGYIFSI